MQKDRQIPSLDWLVNLSLSTRVETHLNFFGLGRTPKQIAIAGIREIIYTYAAK